MLQKMFTPQRLAILVMAVVAFALDHIFLGVASTGVFVAAALAADRGTASREGERFSYPVKQAKLIYSGAIVVLNAGVAQPGETALGLIPVGIAYRQVDNTDGNDGDVNVEVEEGIFLLENSADADEITLADVGSTCFIVDDQTVAKTNGGGTRSICGSIRDVMPDSQVAVEIKNVAHATTGIVAANNGSDFASAATTRENLGANLVTVAVDVTDLIAANAQVVYVPAPVAGTIFEMYSVLTGNALATGDATLTSKINGVGITNGIITITQAGSAIGDVDNCAPTALKTVAKGDLISVTVGGANDDANAKAKVVIVIKT